jgi:hypothetical protein
LNLVVEINFLDKIYDCFRKHEKRIKMLKKQKEIKLDSLFLPPQQHNE